MKESKLIVKNLLKTFSVRDRKIPALRNVSLDIKEGEFVSVLGPSGCGKSTLINAIAGIVKPSRGEILVDGKKVVGPSSHRGVVFQRYSSFPWLTVQENIAFGLKIAGYQKSQREKIAKKYIKVVGLEGFGSEYPKNLSGGMQQRVALARTLATNPDILLMDEPFGALDTQTKRFMQDLLLKIIDETKKTVLFVTHDVDEAVFMSDRVFLMSARPGTVKEIINVPLERPRIPKIEFSDKYNRIYNKVQRSISKESLKTLEGSVADIIKEVYKKK